MNFYFLFSHLNVGKSSNNTEESSMLSHHISSMDYDIFLCKFVHLQLLGRVFNILRENNPELAGDRRRTVLMPPQVLREGTKKTVFVNFMDLCKK